MNIWISQLFGFWNRLERLWVTCLAEKKKKKLCLSIILSWEVYTWLQPQPYYAHFLFITYNTKLKITYFHPLSEKNSTLLGNHPRKHQYYIVHEYRSIPVTKAYACNFSWENTKQTLWSLSMKKGPHSRKYSFFFFSFSELTEQSY